MRVALVHEWFSPHGGSENVALALAELFPDVDIYCLWNDRPELANLVRSSFLQDSRMHGRKALTLPFVHWIWKRLIKEDYDLVLSSSHAFASHVIPSRTSTPHLSYVHTPARYLWSPELDPRGSSRYLAPARAALKAVDQRAAQRITSVAANSQEVAGRIAKFWGRDSTIIHPPVNVDSIAARTGVQSSPRNYLLGFGRWVSYKRMDFVLRVAQRAEMPVVLAGGGPEEKNLRRLASELHVNVRFVLNPSNEEVAVLYAGAAALIYPAHEDFGIVPVEAQAVGTPVVGLNAGGLKETVQHGLSGLLLHKLDVELFAEAVSQVTAYDSSYIARAAQGFNTVVFGNRILDWLEKSSIDVTSLRQHQIESEVVQSGGVNCPERSLPNGNSIIDLTTFDELAPREG